MTSSLGYRDVESWSRQVVAPPPLLPIRRTGTGSSTSSNKRSNSSSSASNRQIRPIDTPPIQPGEGFFLHSPYQSKSLHFRMDGTQPSPISPRTSQDGLYYKNRSLSADDGYPPGSLAVTAAAITAIAASSASSGDQHDSHPRRSASSSGLAFAAHDHLSELRPHRHQHHRHSHRRSPGAEYSTDEEDGEPAEGNANDGDEDRPHRHRRHRRHHHRHHHKHRHHHEDVSPEQGDDIDEDKTPRRSNETTHSHGSALSVTTSPDYTLSQPNSPDTNLSPTSPNFGLDSTRVDSSGVVAQTEEERDEEPIMDPQFDASTRYIPIASSRPASVISAVHHTSNTEPSKEEKTAARLSESSPQCCIIM